LHKAKGARTYLGRREKWGAPGPRTNRRSQDVQLSKVARQKESDRGKGNFSGFGAWSQKGRRGVTYLGWGVNAITGGFPFERIAGFENQAKASGGDRHLWRPKRHGAGRVDIKGREGVSGGIGAPGNVSQKKGF